MDSSVDRGHAGRLDRDVPLSEDAARRIDRLKADTNTAAGQQWAQDAPRGNQHSEYHTGSTAPWSHLGLNSEEEWHGIEVQAG